jgi:oligopeptide/dipeptide ABC transporter ATP-binding protein
MSALLRVEDLKVYYEKKIKAVDGVSFHVNTSEIVGIVGESGCGKSTLGKSILQLIPSTSGKIFLEDTDLTSLHGEALRKRRKDIQMIFQDPYGSLNPRQTLFDILREPLQTHLNLSKIEQKQKIEKTLERVGFSISSLKKYPHEFSGGQRQRIAIARALIIEPKMIIADEPVSSLDVSIQAQILNLLKEIQKETKISMIFISHNLAVVRHLVSKVYVMYLGKIVESAATEEIFSNPLHPYTKALLSSVPIPDPKIERNKKILLISGEIPSPANPPSGCTFHTRCPLVQEHCKKEIPALKEHPNKHSVSCFEV